MEEKAQKSTLKSARRMYLLFTALFLLMAACGPDPFYIPVMSINDVPDTGEAGTPLALKGTIRPAFASNKNIIWLVEDAGTTGAVINGNILNTTSGGTVLIQARVENGMAEGRDYTQEFKIVFSANVPGIKTISAVALAITAPVKNRVPDTIAADIAEGGGHFAIGEVSWLPDDNPFQGETVYTAAVTLTANEGYTFTGLTSATINGKEAVIYDNTETTVTISYTFPATLDKEITGIEVKTQPELIYTHGEPLILDGLVVTLTFDNGAHEDVAYDGFGKYNISTVPAQGTPLNRLTHNEQPVVVTADGHSANTGNLTINRAKAPGITFPTAAAITYGDKLEASTLSGGTEGRGSFSWLEKTAVPSAGTHSDSYCVEFTPTDTDIYDYTDIDGWDSYVCTVARPVSVTVNKKTITITPTAGQNKVYGAADPVEFIYTCSPSLISSDSISGKLGRDDGEDAGQYAIRIGTLTAGSNYTLNLSGSVMFTINRAAGAAVSVPSITWNAGASAINVAAVPAPATGQDVVYAILTTGSGSPSEWKDERSFPVSTAGTYYVYARSAANKNYDAGASNVSAGLTICSVIFNVNGGSEVPAQLVQLDGKATVPAEPSRSGYNFGGWYKEAGFSNVWNFSMDAVSSSPTYIYAKWVVSQGITFEFNPDNSPSVSTGIVIHRSSANGPTTATLTISNYSDYTSVKWWYNDTDLGTGKDLILNSSNSTYNMLGTKFIRVEAWKGGVPYITNVEFKVDP